MKIKDFFSSLSNKKKLLIGIGGFFLIAVVAGATLLPGTLFKGDSSKFDFISTNKLPKDTIEFPTKNEYDIESKPTKDDVDLKGSASENKLLPKNEYINIVKGIETPTANPSPSFSVKSSTAGDLSYEGTCGQIYGDDDKPLIYITKNLDTTVHYKDLKVGIYSDCKITISIKEPPKTQKEGIFFNEKKESLHIPAFEVKALPPAQQQKGSINTSSDFKSSLDNATFNTDNFKSTKNKEELTCEGKLTQDKNSPYNYIIEWNVEYYNNNGKKENIYPDTEQVQWYGDVDPENGSTIGKKIAISTKINELPLRIPYNKKDFEGKTVAANVFWTRNLGNLEAECSTVIKPAGKDTKKDEEKKDEDTLLETIPVKDKTLKEDEKSDSNKLNATCSISPNPAKVGESVTFTANATGGDGKNYSYYWLVDLNGNQNKKSFTYKFDKVPTNANYQVLVISDKETSVAKCPELKFTTVTSSDNKKTDDKKTDDKKEEDEKKDTKTDSKSLSKCEGVYYPSDIEGHWAESYIKQGYDKCLFKGIDGKFYPDRSATRIESSSMILYALNREPVSDCSTYACSTPFKDLQSIDQGAILNKLYFTNLIQGYSDNTFKPQSLITRAEASSLIVKAFFEPFSKPCTDPHCGAGWPDNFFLDINDTWQGRYIRVLWDNGIMTGTGKNKVEPNRNITRAEMAKMIVLSNEKLKK